MDELIKGLSCCFLLFILPQFKLFLQSITECNSDIYFVVPSCLKLPVDKKYAVKDVVAGMAYEFRVTAINFSGAGEFSNPSEFVFARDPKSKCNILYIQQEQI